MNAIDLFAGPGGWDEGLLALGIRPLGIELDAAACTTREAAGHRTLQADIATLDPAVDFAPCDLLIGSPPCPTFSTAGKRSGLDDMPLIRACAESLARGRDTRDRIRPQLGDPRSLLVVEPLRWALELRPRLIALEQVPTVLPLWEHIAGLLRVYGWHTWTGTLNAEQYGVPQTRVRAFLLASLDGPVTPPAPTHRRYIAPPREDDDTPRLFDAGDRTAIIAPGEEHLLPWISMADALGWTDGLVGFPRAVDRGGRGDYRERDLRAVTDPAFALTETARSWQRFPLLEERQEHGARREATEPAPTLTASMDNGNFRWLVNTGRDWKPGGSREDAQTFDATEQPAPTVDGKGRWHVVDTGNTRGGTRESGRRRDADEPAAVLTTRADQLELRPPWADERPATTIQGDPRVFPPGGHLANDGRDNSRMVGRSECAVRVSLEDASVLQGFRRDYPWQGTKSKQFEQVGNAVPPPLARAVVAALVPDAIEAA